MVRNSEGVTVDPVPFLVVSVLGFAVSFAVGPLYAMAFGVSLEGGLVLAAAATLATAAVAYHRYVWTERPSLRGEIPGAVRFQRLVYGMVAGFLAVIALTLPLVVR